MTRTKIYLAGPLFSTAEREFNRRLVDALCKEMPNCEVNLPQEFAASIKGKVKGKVAFADTMFGHCLRSIDAADIVLAILDGPDVDAGTCVEIGYAYAKKKRIIGIRTDFRSSEDKGVNLMVSKACDQMIWLTDSSVTMGQIISKIVAVLNPSPTKNE